MNTLTHLTTDDQGHTLLYDAWNRVFAVRDGQNHVIESYTYDGLGRRVTVTNASGELTNISYSSSGQVLEEDSDGSVLTRNVWSPVYANALLLRDRDTNADGILDQRLYFTSDANFNVTGVLNASGNVVQRQVYDAYGTVAFTDANWDTRATDNYALENLYQGMQYDAAIGWYVTPTRLYSPTLKVWNRTEPSDGVPYVDGPNLYQAFAANPINSTDSTRLWKQVGSKTDDRATWESEGNDTLADLADKVTLSNDINEMNMWLQGGTIHFQYRNDTAQTGSISKNDRFAPLCHGQKLTVLNVWIAGNLLQGGNLYSQFVNIGGIVGMIPTDLAVQKKVVKATTFADLVNAVNANSGNIWGIVIFGHGGKNGYLGDYDGNGPIGGNWGSQQSVINGLSGQGFHVAQSWAMQCYSFFQGIYKGRTYDWKKQWESVSLNAHGYQGINALGIDTGN